MFSQFQFPKCQDKYVSLSTQKRFKTNSNAFKIAVNIAFIDFFIFGQQLTRMYFITTDFSSMNTFTFSFIVHLLVVLLVDLINVIDFQL